MQVAVGSEALNVRTERPSVNAPNIVYKLPGDIIDIDGKLYKGDSYRDIDTWVKDLAGNYYWSGGLNLFQQWFTDLNIPEIWSYATGKGVGVAIVDTGVAIGIPNLPIGSNHFVFDGSSNSTDTDGHGTFCAGLVGLNSFQSNSIGVAPDSQIIAVKIANGRKFNDNETDSQRYADAINWCANQQNIHVISISWGNQLNDATVKTNIQTAINLAISKGKIVVCAIGDAFFFGDNTQYFPACLHNTIAVGCIPVANTVYSFINSSLSIALNGANISSYEIPGFSYKNKGDSWSNAILAGLVALVIQKLNFNYSFSSIQSVITEWVSNTEYSMDSFTKSLPVLDGNKLLNFFKS